jgi:hypothetical protein
VLSDGVIAAANVTAAQTESLVHPTHPGH